MLFNNVPVHKSKGYPVSCQELCYATSCSSYSYNNNVLAFPILFSKNYFASLHNSSSCLHALQVSPAQGSLHFLQYLNFFSSRYFFFRSGRISRKALIIPCFAPGDLFSNSFNISLTPALNER